MKPFHIKHEQLVTERSKKTHQVSLIRGQRGISNSPTQALCKNILLNFPTFLYIVNPNMASLKVKQSKKLTLQTDKAKTFP